MQTANEHLTAFNAAKEVMAYLNELAQKNERELRGKSYEQICDEDLLWLPYPDLFVNAFDEVASQFHDCADNQKLENFRILPDQAVRMINGIKEAQVNDHFNLPAADQAIEALSRLQ